MKLLDAIKLAYTAYKSKALVCVPNQHYTATVRAVPSHSQYDKQGLHGIYEINITLGDVEICTVRRKGIDFKRVHKELIRKSDKVKMLDLSLAELTAKDFNEKYEYVYTPYIDFADMIQSAVNEMLPYFFKVNNNFVEFKRHEGTTLESDIMHIADITKVIDAEELRGRLEALKNSLTSIKSAEHTDNQVYDDAISHVNSAMTQLEQARNLLDEYSFVLKGIEPENLKQIKDEVFQVM